jgi:hypothetical protein
MALTFRAGVHLLAGEFAAALALIEEADALIEAIGNAPFFYGSLIVNAWRGRGAQALDLIAAGLDQATRRGEGRAITFGGVREGCAVQRPRRLRGRARSGPAGM